MREIGAAPKVRLTVLHQHSDFPGLTTAALPACCSVSPAAILAIPALPLLSGWYPRGMVPPPARDLPECGLTRPLPAPPPQSVDPPECGPRYLVSRWRGC